MAHLLLLEVPGGNDFTVLEDARALGHEVTFVTGDLAQYRAQGEAVQAGLALAREVLEVRPFDDEELERAALAVHARHPFDGLLCILDIRIVAAARLAARLGLRFLNPATARLARDKVQVREALARHGLRQPAFALAESPAALGAAVAAVGYPALVKPVDGFGSQQVSLLSGPADLAALQQPAAGAAPADYGLGVRASDRFSVERYIEGRMIGCDVFTWRGADGRPERVFLGINDKLMFAPPSFAMRGSCFPSARYDMASIRDYAFAVLDAVDFDFGAAHVEMIVAADGPYLVEINPRLVSAQIPHQMAYALERSVYAELISLHLGQPVAALAGLRPRWFSAIRWITAERSGSLLAIDLPPDPDPLVRRVVLFKQAGDAVRPPLSNGDRIGYVIAVGETERAAEQCADSYVRASHVRLQ